MYTGKMTATWLIIITMVSIVAVPMLIIYFAMLLPYDQAHPEAHAGEFILGLVTLIPNVSTPGFISGLLA
jgi:hypothetical protein